MGIPDHLQRIQALLPDVAAWCDRAFLDEPVLRPGCTEEELADFERAVGAQLPADYRELLVHCRELQADGPGPGVHLFSPYTVVGHHYDSSTPNRLLDGLRGVESHVATIGLFRDQPLLIEVRGGSVGQLFSWPRGEEVRFDGSASVSCEPAFSGVAALLETLVAQWSAELGGDG